MLLRHFTIFDRKREVIAKLSDRTKAEPGLPGGIQRCARCIDGGGFQPWTEPLPMLVDTVTRLEGGGWKRLGCRADLHTVSKCRTRGE